MKGYTVIGKYIWSWLFFDKSMTHSLLFLLYFSNYTTTSTLAIFLFIKNAMTYFLFVYSDIYCCGTSIKQVLVITVHYSIYEHLFSSPETIFSTLLRIRKALSHEDFHMVENLVTVQLYPWMLHSTDREDFFHKCYISYHRKLHHINTLFNLLMWIVHYTGPWISCYH